MPAETAGPGSASPRVRCSARAAGGKRNLTGEALPGSAGPHGERAHDSAKGPKRTARRFPDPTERCGKWGRPLNRALLSSAAWLAMERLQTLPNCGT